MKTRINNPLAFHLKLQFNSENIVNINSFNLLEGFFESLTSTFSAIVPSLAIDISILD